MKKTTAIENAMTLINETRGKTLLLKERKEKAVQLAAAILNESQLEETASEKKTQDELSQMIDDPKGKLFTLSLTDQCFRTKDSFRVADQVQYVMENIGIPSYFSGIKKLLMGLFFVVGKWFAPITVPLLKKMIHQESGRFILPGEPDSLEKALKRKQTQNLRVNLNHLGEAILGETEAENRLNIYLEDLKKPEVEYISVKISTLFSQINLVAWEESLKILSIRLKQLLDVASKEVFLDAQGFSHPKFVNLDMEEYKDLHLTVALFKHVLSQPSYRNISAGIVLQSYLPDSFLILKDLTEWALKRQKEGGAPIKIRLVKGANLAMERVDAALHNWNQAPYLTKTEVDSNFKKMLNFALQKENAKAVHIGIGSHNLFDIAYSLILRSENQLEKEVSFEMLEGMAEPVRRVVKKLSGSILLYCPAAKKEEFQNAVAYLVRRLDENTNEENFMRQVFKLKVGSEEWERQVYFFLKSCENIETVSESPNRNQDRNLPQEVSYCCRFENEADTDWSLKSNRLWGINLLKDSKNKDLVIPLVINGKTYNSSDFLEEGLGINPSEPDKPLYRYGLANDKLIEEALKTANETQNVWSQTPPRERALLLLNIAKEIRDARSILMSSMVLDTGKTLVESDPEISEAIDFAEYYARNLLEITSLKDIEWESRGPTLVASPWNFPCSIPAGGILAALAAGNTVIFKPAPEAIWVGWELVQLFWKAGVSKKVLQFVNCLDEPQGTKLIKDPRLALVVLTGATSTAKYFLKARPSMHLIAETGGKNAIIVSNMADRDQAVKDVIQSAFGHAGQKCSACSLLICVQEIYDDPVFKQQLKDAAESLPVGSPLNAFSRLNPLIKPPGEILFKALTNLDAGESWLVKPKQDPLNPHLWSPGIKWGVKMGSFMQKEELFGPVLAVMKADSLEHAIQMVNQSSYGLTTGLQSLDQREQKYWSDRIQAGNCYINRGITGAIVQRQPFGGWKNSGFSPGAKAGGPNYLMQFLKAKQIDLPLDGQKIDPKFLKQKILLNSEHQALYEASLKSYTFYWDHYFKFSHDPSKVLGEDNFLRYMARKNICIRIDESTELVDVLRLHAAAQIVDADCWFSFETEKQFKKFKDLKGTVEDRGAFLKRLKTAKTKRVRFLNKPEASLAQALVDQGCYITVAPVIANGRIELLNFLREQSLSVAYHRYGNLGEREGEMSEKGCCH
jgi:RHH-type proline utilization regulon transcriptional repressor/proline dehydrogenase/delta 1-pyrroline-5-carboxylate dehydrogenase